MRKISIEPVIFRKHAGAAHIIIIEDDVCIGGIHHSEEDLELEDGELKKLILKQIKEVVEGKSVEPYELDLPEFLK